VHIAVVSKNGRNISFSAFVLFLGKWKDIQPVKKCCRCPKRCSLGNQAGFRKTWVFKKPNPLGFIGFWALLFFSRFLCLSEQLGSLLVDLAHQLSFCLDLPVLQII